MSDSQLVRGICVLLAFTAMSCTRKAPAAQARHEPRETLASSVGRGWSGTPDDRDATTGSNDVELEPGPGRIASPGSGATAGDSAVVDAIVRGGTMAVVRDFAAVVAPARDFEEALLVVGAASYRLRLVSEDDSTVGLWQVMTTVDGRPSVCLTAIDRPGSGFVGWPFRPSRRQAGSFPFMWSSDGGCPEPNAGETLAAWFARLEHGGLKVVPLNRIAEARIVR